MFISSCLNGNALSVCNCAAHFRAADLKVLTCGMTLFRVPAPFCVPFISCLFPTSFFKYSYYSGKSFTRQF